MPVEFIDGAKLGSLSLSDVQEVGERLISSLKTNIPEFTEELFNQYGLCLDIAVLFQDKTDFRKNVLTEFTDEENRIQKSIWIPMDDNVTEAVNTRYFLKGDPKTRKFDACWTVCIEAIIAGRRVHVYSTHY